MLLVRKPLKVRNKILSNFGNFKLKFRKLLEDTCGNPAAEAGWET